MPAQLALLICLGAIICVIIWDSKFQQGGSWSLIIPGLWMAIQGSRPLSYWLSGGEGWSGADAKPIDTLCYLSMICGAIAFLNRMRFPWGNFFSQNKALIVLYIYLALSSMWSEYPGLSFKRIFKDFGVVLVALV